MSTCEHAKTCGDCWTTDTLDREHDRAEKAEARVAELQAQLERRATEGPAVLQLRCGGCGVKLADHRFTYERGPATLACPTDSVSIGEESNR